MKKIIICVAVLATIGLAATSCSNATRHCYEVTSMGGGYSSIYHTWASQDEMEYEKAEAKSENRTFEYKKDSKYKTMEDCVDKMYMEN
ncbi:MAG: hypothetical protein MJZ95_05430 [Paludibacteraceae bacterium]|nr:hypothetical protein [Paludibacteraceae bacterium]